MVDDPGTAQQPRTADPAEPGGAPVDGPAPDAPEITPEPVPDGTSAPVATTPAPSAPETAGAAPVDPARRARVEAARARHAARELKRERLNQRTMAQRYPYFGPATLGLLVTGVVIGYVSLVTVGRDVMHRCTADQAHCDPRTQGLMLALPALATALGLAVAAVGGRMLVARDRSPMPAVKAGWAILVLAVIVGTAVKLFG